MSNTPFLLSDNLFENVVLHPTYVLGQSGSDDTSRHETFRVADNLRDLTSWTCSGQNAARTIYVDALAAVTPDTMILDRGHNLAGVTVAIRSYLDALLPMQVQAPVLTPSGTGGTLAAGTYFYKITATNAAGESIAGVEASTTVSGTTSSIALSWTAVTGATGYRIYRGTAAGGESVYYTSSTASYTDTNAASTAGTPPATTGSLIASCTIPSTAGGLSTDANGCLTPDGVWWKTFTPISNRVQGLAIPALGAGIAPIVTGLYMGASYRFPELLNAPAANDYGTQIKFMRNELSRGGLRSKSRPLNFDKLAFNVSLESTDYTGFDTQVRRLLRYGHPWWFCLDDSDVTGCGLMRLFQSAADMDYDPQANPLHREIQFQLEEVLPTLYA